MLISDVSTVKADDAKGWSSRAPQLASWVWHRMVNRVTRWGGYSEKGKTTHPQRKRDRGKVRLTRQVIEQHFRATHPGRIIGLHTTSNAGFCRWGALDVDCHGDASWASQTQALAGSLSYRRLLLDLGFDPVLERTGRGFHIWTFFSEFVDSRRLFLFLQALAADHLRHGLVSMPETFPKQPRAGGYSKFDLEKGEPAPPPLGGWIRLPGQHHKYADWSRFWTGIDWAHGAEAADLLMDVEPSPAAQLPGLPALPVSEPPPSAPPPVSPTTEPTAPRWRRLRASGPVDDKQRARWYLHLDSSKPNATPKPLLIPEGERNTSFYKLAKRLAGPLEDDFHLSAADTLELLEELNETIAVPLDRGELRDTITNATRRAS